MPFRTKNAIISARKSLHVRSGNTIVRVYRSIYSANGTSYEQFTVSYREGQKRIRKTFHHYEEARLEAEKIANHLEQGQKSALKITNIDAELFALAQREAATLGFPLLEIVRHYKAALEALPADGSLLEAAREYSIRHAHSRSDKTVAQVLDEFLESKKQDGASAVYLRTLRYHLNPLRERFQTLFENVTAADLDDWLRGLGRSNRTRKNALVSLTTLFRFARSRGYIPKNVPTEAESVARPKIKAGDVGIITPEELKLILESADTDERRIYFAIGAFTGIRATEMARLQWRHINLERRHIEITAANAKTASRRLVPVCDALYDWLLPHQSKSGGVFSSQRSAERLVEWAGKKIGHWPQNALRHSFVSYRVAQTQNVAQVALEAGNSPQMVFANYRELVTKDAAARWFSIYPLSIS